MVALRWRGTRTLCASARHAKTQKEEWKNIARLRDQNDEEPRQMRDSLIQWTVALVRKRSR